MTNPLKTWDMTIKAIPHKIDEETLQTWFKSYCFKWMFQKEKGELNGYEHYQCRFTLKKKLRAINLREQLLENLETEEFHVTPTSSNCIRNGEEYYCMKEETRIDGPWMNENTQIPIYYRNVTLRPWQQAIVEEMAAYKMEGRRINLIVNTKGNDGKSFLTNYLLANEMIYVIPPIDDYKEIMQFMMSVYQTDKPVIIDVPRGLSMRKQLSFYSAVETIKSGFLWDSRYRGRYKIINPPCVYIFCNYLPDRSLLSWDRWFIRHLIDGELKDLTTK